MNEALSVYEARKALWPTMRRRGVVGIVVSTSVRRVVVCAVCGESESCSNKYPPTKRLREFEAAHEDRCGGIAQAAVLRARETGEDPHTVLARMKEVWL